MSLSMAAVFAGMLFGGLISVLNRSQSTTLEDVRFLCAGFCFGLSFGGFLIYRWLGKIAKRNL